MEYFGLLVEFLFLCLGLYLYLFAVGKVKSGDEAAQKKAEAFRQKNMIWLRPAALALTAIMAVNLYIHIRQMMAG